MNLRTFLKAPLAAILLIAAPNFSSAAVITYIDLFTDVQTVNALNSTTVDTTTAANALGGFRTITLTAAGNDPGGLPNQLRVTTSPPQGPRLILTTQAESTPTFEVKWGGANGTAGLGGVNLTLPGFGLPATMLNFSLRTADLANNFTWSFTDTATNTATYTGSFPVKTTANPALEYAISLASFANAGAVNWSSINFITLSGGGITDLDLTLNTPITIAAVPEPGTWAAAGLLVLAAAYIRWRRSRSSAIQEEATAAA